MDHASYEGVFRVTEPKGSEVMGLAGEARMWCIPREATNPIAARARA